MRMVKSQPSFIPRFSAAMEGCLIHSCSRCTDSSCRFSISFWIALRSSAAAPPDAQPGKASEAAPTNPLAATPCKNARRSTDEKDIHSPAFSGLRLVSLMISSVMWTVGRKLAPAVPQLTARDYTAMVLPATVYSISGRNSFRRWLKPALGGKTCNVRGWENGRK